MTIAIADLAVFAEDGQRSSGATAVVDGSAFVRHEDRARAEEAIEAALVAEGIVTGEQFNAALNAYLARTDGEDCDAALADKYERILSASDIALTKGWHDPDGASLSIGRL